MDVVGLGHPLLLMHGGPGADHWTLLPFRRCADRFTLVFYDHRCNGRSVGAPVSSMTWENLTADADALRQRLGYERWAVLGHSFGGKVALEYALRYPESLSHLVLLDTGGDSRWAQEHAPELLARRGFSPAAMRVPPARRCIVLRVIESLDRWPLDADEPSWSVEGDGRQSGTGLIAWLTASENPAVRYLTFRDLVEPRPSSVTLERRKTEVWAWGPLRSILRPSAAGWRLPRPTGHGKRLGRRSGPWASCTAAAWMWMMCPSLVRSTS